MQYIYDPDHPVPTLGGNHCGIMDLPSYEAKLDPLWHRYLEPVPRLQNIVALGPMHQKESPDVFGAKPPYPLLANRDDVLVFQTEPLAEAIEMTGAAVVLSAMAALEAVGCPVKVVGLLACAENAVSGSSMRGMASMARLVSTRPSTV